MLGITLYSDYSLRPLELMGGSSSSPSRSDDAYLSRLYPISGFQLEEALFQLATALDNSEDVESGELGERFMKGVVLCVTL